MNSEKKHSPEELIPDFDMSRFDVSTPQPVAGTSELVLSEHDKVALEAFRKIIRGYRDTLEPRIHPNPRRILEDQLLEQQSS